MGCILAHGDVMSRFALAVSDEEETKLRATGLPENTKTATEWGIRVWSEWATNRVSSVVT